MKLERKMEEDCEVEPLFEFEEFQKQNKIKDRPKLKITQKDRKKNYSVINI